VAANYARAREAWADYHFEALLAIADTPQIGETVVTRANGTVEVKRGDMVDRARLQIDARKWIIARAAPKKYGDKVEQTINANVRKVENQLSEEEAQAEIDRALGIIRGTPQIDRALAEND
jgi:hypothetical protein